MSKALHLVEMPREDACRLEEEGLGAGGLDEKEEEVQEFNMLLFLPFLEQALMTLSLVIRRRSETTHCTLTCKHLDKGHK
jgi:hypothetical protein